MSGHKTPENAKHLKALGSNATTYNYGMGGEPDPAVLEKFPNPSNERIRSGHAVQAGGIKVTIATSEFTSLCPKTGQPDYATILVEYVPGEWCVESKSFKLYLMQFRMHGEFHEACVDRIGRDLVALLDPQTLEVVGQFTPRGGIKFHPTFRYVRQSLIAQV